MTSPVNPDETPEQAPRQAPKQPLPPSSPPPGAPEDRSYDDPTRTMGAAALPPVPPRTPQPPVQRPPVSPTDPTLTQWSAYGPGQAPPGAQPPQTPYGAEGSRQFGQQAGQPYPQQPGPANRQTPYGQPYNPQEGQPPRQASSSQPQYGQPQYGQPQYGQPQYGQPQYGQPQYGQPQYGQPHSQQQFGQPYAPQPYVPPSAAPVSQTSLEPAAEPAREPAQQTTAVKPVRRKARSLFWPGFAFGFLLLASLTCGLSAAALGLNQLSLDDLRGGTGASWTPGPVTPVPTQAATSPDASASAPAGEAGRFAAGQTVRNLTNSRVNIRMSPGYLGKPASDVIGQINPGETLQILGDATVADELTWWRIQATSSGQTVVGWVAEATSSGVQILGPAQ